MTNVYIGMGSNLGRREAYLREALGRLIAAGTVTVEAVSSLYETAPMEIAEQPAFLNAVARIRTDLAPRALLALLKETERKVGRVQRMRFGPREVDLDMLLYGEDVLAAADLTIPHPRMAQRAFVLVPLDELAPGLLFPGSGTPIATLLPAARAGGAVTRLRGPDWYPGP